jgi:signal transduction histidine kinase
MVTERAELAQPASTVDELRAAVAARDELVAVIGHELRNAMSPLVMLAQYFENVPVDDVMRAKVAMLSRNLTTLLGTLDRVGELAQLRDGKLVLDPRDVDVAVIVREVASELAPFAAAQNSEIAIDATSVVGRWDPERLKQIVRHLVDNALRHGAGPVEISVRACETGVEIVVDDAGPGIAANERAYLFDRFDRRLAHRRGGLGVGLWVVKALCHAMGGSVRLASDRPARFCVALPRG